MGAPPALSNLDIGELCGAAGGNPWKLDDELQAGDPQAINKLADAFHQAGNRVKEADDDFDKAKQKFNAAYTRNQGEHPINESAEVQQATTALAGHKEALPRIAASLEQTAASLATAQRQSDAALGQADSALHELDNQLSAAKANDQDTGVLHEQAVGVVKSALGQVNSARSAYVTDLHAAETAMSGAGYVPESLGNLDALPGDDAAKAATQYDKSGQRARDQAMVDKAKAEGRTHYMANDAGRPGNMTAEEAAAAQRLKDYAAITDPNSRFGPGFDPHQAAQARRLAGERLGDYNTSKVVGPLTRDPVFGVDARTRAQARLQLQHDLEQGQLPWSRQFMTPDQATQVIDQMEATDRATAVAKFQEALQKGGMSPPAAAAVAEDMAHGEIPKELVAGASSVGKGLDGGKEGFTHWAEAMPTDDFLSTARFSAEDVEAFKRIGGRIGAAGSLLEAGIGLYEIFGEGKPAGEVVAKSAGGMAGAYALGGLGAEGGFLVAGPPGAFAGALIFGTAGAFLGEDAGEKVFKWFKE
ncbi:hypothetical protein [Mycobacterium celatum]|uniref:Predicted hydrolase N-terminal domain-containing protein n=1 Tax=Mycobacterium celatum TaxID=28045 RepID=A0A1X1RSD5_MYCCE|nr:hypothetical protein [Mycobacterium celatum]ORV14715.1 hypothetical protein AWB95_08825 [Mycobacterium celatum]PIB79969.1 hypothetical protein CQY23_04855 [Mycobacterium celatum]